MQKKGAWAGGRNRRKPKHKYNIFGLSLLAECGCSGFGLGSVFGFRFLLSIFGAVCRCYLFVIPWALVFANTRIFVVH